MITQKAKASLTMGKDYTLTLRVWLSEEDKQKFVLEKGKQPNTIIKNFIIM